MLTVSSAPTIRNKLQEWGVRRYSNEAEMSAVIRKAKQASVHHDAKRYWVGGRVVTLGHAFQYFQQKGIPRDRWDADALPYRATPEGFRS